MIQFNKTINQVARYLAVVLIVCLGTNHTILADSSTQYGKLTADPVGQKAVGLIYMNESETSWPDYENFHKTAGPVDFIAEGTYYDAWIFGRGYIPTTIHCYANETGVPNAMWAGWYKGTEKLQDGASHIAYEMTPNSSSKNNPSPNETITAKWVQPQVESVTPNPVLFNITDPTIVVPNQPATFTVKDCSMASHFSLVYEENSNFTILDNTFTFATNAAPDIFNGTATISVGYTPTIEHGEHDGYAILKSALYSGTEYTDETSKLYKRVNFKAIENYKPEFEASNNSKDLALDLGSTTYGVTSQEVGPTRQSNSGDLKPDNTTRNYAAKQPRYSSGLRQKTTTWTTTIVEESGFEGLFEFVKGTKDTDDPQVVFTPKRDIVGKKTWSGEGTTHTFYAQIKMVCTFYDNKTTPEQIPSDTKSSWVKVTVEQTDKEELYYTYDVNEDGTYDYTHNFGDVAMGEVQSITIPFYQANIQDLQATKTYGENSADIFETKLSGDQLVVSIKKDVITCGPCTLTISLDGIGNISKKTISTANNFTVYANMTLATPQVTAIGSNGKITFTWNKIQGATSYVVYSDAALKTPIKTIPANDADQYQYIKEGLKSTGASFTAYVVAVGECDNSESGTATGTTNISTIKLGNASAEALGMVTGMEGNSDYTTYPYSQLRKVDVTAAFDKNGKALFDCIYIFEKTEIKNSKWVTPYYVYNRSAVDTYTKVGGDNPYTITQGATSKDERLNAINIAEDCNELYFTGYLPYGVTGNENQNAVLHFKGDGSKELHLYLDSLQIYAAGKSGNTIQPGTNDLATNYYTKGNGSAIAIESSSSSNPFIVNIHLRGRNTLDAAKGSNVRIYNSQVSGMDDSPNHYSSPICVLPTGNNQVATLKFTDNWPTDVENKLAMTHTYGALNLKEKDNDNQSGISIDLGNAYTQLEFNGGQYKFQDIAAAYKTTFYSGNKDDVTVNVTVYGVSSSRFTTTTRRGSDISIKDGTFNAAGNNGITFYGSSLTIDGGSYYTGDEDNSGIPRENGTGNIGLVLYNTDDADRSPVTTFWNSDGKELHKFLINYSDIYGSIARGNENDADYNAAIITNFGQMMNDLFPHAGVDDAATGTTYHKSLAQYYDGTNKIYGNNSLVLKNGKLNLMVPYLDCNGVHLPWQVCAPSIHAEHAMGTIPVGGDISNLGGCPQHSKNNTIDRMLFMQLDEYTLDCLEDGRPIKDNNVQGNSVTLVYTEDAVYGNIRDAVPYTITNKVYMLMPIVAAKWTLFSPPFDVANVYVIEPCPEDQLVKDFNGVRGKIRGQENIAAARKEQAGRIIDLYSMWYAHARNIGVTPSDFFGTDAATPYGSFVNDWIAYEEVNKINSDGIYTPVIEKLIHFMGKEANYSIYGEGKNWLDANYYIYQQKPEGWTFDGTHYTCGWDTVTTVADGTNAIMSQGQVYAIQFPFNSINGTHDPSTTWDYWTGKYLLIESTAGPHTINGSNFVTSALSVQNVASGTASLFGNSTFTEIAATMPTEGGTSTTMWALEKKSATTEGGRDIHEMVQKTNTTLAPTSGVLLANFQAPQGTIAKSINYTTGEITYEKVDEPGTGDIETGLPTIAGDLTLLVESTEQGLTITPIKEQHVMLFDADGKMIFSKYLSAEENVTLPTGVYVVRGEYEQVKAIKK